MSSLKEWIVRCLGLMGVLTWGGGISGSLWAGLHHLGDAGGAGFAQGTFWGIAVCWGMTLMALLGLLTTGILWPDQLAPVRLTSGDQPPQPKVDPYPFD